MQQKSKFFPITKNCASCHFWVGNRELSDNQKYITAYSDTEGKCYGKYFKLKKLAKNIGVSCWQEFELIAESCDNQSSLQKLQDTIENIKNDNEF